ncbi:kinase-like domain-containing protein [Armillaria fumosa]|nr:kinase-like domain-containing protein [Armillaria fumosa]
MTLLLMEVTPVNTPMIKSILDTLKDHSDALKSFNAVTSLVRSQVYRGSLLQIASVLGLSDDPRVREALQADEEVIADLLHHVSQSDSDREEVLALLDDDAQNFLNVVQDVLDRGFLLDDPAEGLKARRLLVKLSSTCYKLPSKLFIEGVELSDAHATFGGGFGDVFRASYNGQVVALKRMRIFQRDPNLPSIRRRFCQEALTWQSLKHAYIVPFLGIVAEEFPTALCMVSPWMRNGTVLKYLADNGRVNVNKRLYEISQGLAYLHSQHIVHGDLRGSNILINDDWQACLTDFGLTVFNDATPATYTSRHEGSVRWMAPELYFPQSFGLDRFRLTPASDVYALGCVCLELYTGRAPFHDIFHDPAIVLKVAEGKRPERPSGSEAMPDELWKLVESCWSHQFSDRPHIDTVVNIMSTLSHPLRILASPRADILTPIQEKVNLGYQKRVHFDVPDSSGSTTSLGSTSAQTLPSVPSSKSISITTPTLASPTTPLDDLEYYEPESDGSSSATDLFDNDSKDDESTISSTSRDDLDLSFDSQLLVSPRKSRPSGEPRVNFVGHERGTGEAAGIWDFDAELDEQLYWDMSLLSEATLCLRTRIIKDTNIRNGVSYPSSFNGKNIITMLRACIEEKHDDTDTPLPLESLVLDIARSLQRQFLFCEVGSLEWGEETICNSEERIYRFLDDQEDSLSTSTDDEVPTGVIPMLTPCYSPTCSDDWPCFSHTCPRWGKAQPSRPQESGQPAIVGSKVKTSGVMISSTRPADITLLLDHFARK